MLMRTSNEERNQKVLDHYKIVKTIALQIHRQLPKNVDIKDLISSGVVGLMEALSRYDSGHGIPLKTYVRYRIRGAIIDTLRATDWSTRYTRTRVSRIESTRSYLRSRLDRAPTREEMAESISVSLARFDEMCVKYDTRPLLSLDAPASKEDDTPLIEQAVDPFDFVEAIQQDQLRDWVVEAVQGLPEQERVVVGMYYLHELPLKKIGVVIGVSESRVSQIKGAGIERIRKRLLKYTGNLK